MEELEGFRSYTFKGKYGIDDLLNTYAWLGNSQGDSSATNDIRTGINSEGWMTYCFNGIDPSDQKAINAEAARRKALNDKYIAKLKEEGKYGKEYPLTIHMKHNPIFDDPNKK